MDAYELPAGPGQVIVVYPSEDTGDEVDPEAIFAAIAHDAARRAAAGQWIVSMTSMPIRHSGVAMGRAGSGYVTKASVAVVYGLPRPDGGGPQSS